MSAKVLKFVTFRLCGEKEGDFLGGVQLLKYSSASMQEFDAQFCHNRNHFLQSCPLVRVAFIGHKAPTSLDVM